VLKTFLCLGGDNLTNYTIKKNYLKCKFGATKRIDIAKESMNSTNKTTIATNLVKPVIHNFKTTVTKTTIINSKYNGTIDRPKYTITN